EKIRSGETRRALAGVGPAAAGVARAVSRRRVRRRQRRGRGAPDRGPGHLARRTLGADPRRSAAFAGALREALPAALPPRVLALRARCELRAVREPPMAARSGSETCSRRTRRYRNVRP